PRLDPQLLQHGRIVVERMTGQEEADCLVLAAQSLGREPWFGLRQRNLLPDSSATEQFTLPNRSRVVAALRTAKHGIDCRENPRAIFLECIDRARRRKAFKHTLVNSAWIHPRGKIREIAKCP